MNIADLRRDYKLQALDESQANANPIEQFRSWFAEAVASEALEPNAMTLCTVDADGRPSARIVLLKGIEPMGLTFFTNYESRKAADLMANPQVALVLFWPELERQVRIEGEVTKVGRAESDAYFQSRPRASQLGAWASPQSSTLGSRADLEREFEELSRRFGDGDISCPPHWGGYRVTPDRFEFWQGRRSRLHDRLQYLLVNGAWKIERLAP